MRTGVIELFRKNSVFISWLLSYLLVLFVPIFIGAVVYTTAEKTVEREINFSNRLMMDQSQQVLDDGLRDIQRVITQVNMNGKFKQLMNINQQTLYSNYYDDVIQAINDFKYYKVLTSYTADFFIYFHNIERVFTGSGLLEEQIFFKSKVENNSFYGLSREEWGNLLNGDYSGQYRNWSPPQTEGGHPAGGTIYSVTLPVNDTKDPRATLIMILNDKRILELIQSMRTEDNGWGMIIDKDNHVLFSTIPSVELPSELHYDRLSNHPDVAYMTINGEKVVVSYTDSEIVRWRYISVIPDSVFWGKVESIRQLTIVCTILCIVLGAVISLFLAWKNYIPINKLLYALSNKPEVTRSKGLNEYKFIQEAISENISENMSIREKLNQQNNVLRTTFLIKLLKGKADDADYIEKALATYRLSFESEQFAVVIFYITDLGTLLEGYHKHRTPEEKLAFAQFIISNIMKEQVDREHIGYMVEVDEMIVGLINFKPADSNPKQTLLRVVNEAFEFIGEKFNIHVVAGISDTHPTYFGISEAYREALHTIEYQLAMESGEVARYEDLKGFDGKYNYSIETENKLINCIKAGDFENSKAILNDIFETNFSKSRLPNSLVKTMMFGLANTMFKAMMEVSYICGEEMINGLRMGDRLLKCEKVQELKKEMTDILETVCHYIANNKTGKRSQLVDNTAGYIEAHYGDVNLSVAVIAEHLDLTPAYLTKLFKEQHGEGIFDYISRVRIEKAKELLNDHDLSVKDIAERVGYINSNVFIRAFKKFTGLTPGKYRGTE